MEVTLNKYYPFLVWLFILVVSPTLAMIWNAIAEPWDFDSSYLLMPLFLAISGVFVSLPAFGLFFLSFRQIPKLIDSPIILKAVFIFICLIVTTFTIYFLFDKIFLEPSNRDGFRVFLSYLITVPIGVLSFKLYK
jgi:hypothetical protein